MTWSRCGKAVVEARQRLSQAQRLLEQQLGKELSLQTLKRFLKKLRPLQTDTKKVDESQVSPEGYVPYDWQFEDEQVCITSAKGKGLNGFALISRDNRMVYATSKERITTAFIVEQLDRISLSIAKPTVVILDHASVHTAAKLQKQLEDW